MMVTKNLDDFRKKMDFGPKNCIFGPKFCIFLRYTYETPIFWGQTHRTGLITCPPYPEVTLDTFGFPVGGRLAARRAVFRPRLPKVALFGSGRVFIASTPNFGPSLTKLVGTIRFTKKMTHNDNGAGPGRIYGETAVFYVLPKSGKRAENPFFSKKNSEIC